MHHALCGITRSRRFCLCLSRNSKKIVQSRAHAYTLSDRQAIVTKCPHTWLLISAAEFRIKLWWKERGSTELFNWRCILFSEYVCTSRIEACACEHDIHAVNHKMLLFLFPTTEVCVLHGFPAALPVSISAVTSVWPSSHQRLPDSWYWWFGQGLFRIRTL